MLSQLARPFHKNLLKNLDIKLKKALYLISLSYLMAPIVIYLQSFSILAHSLSSLALKLGHVEYK